MKTLQESLFDKDIVKNSDVKLGELYELSSASHENMISNDYNRMIQIFDIRKLRKENFDLKVDTNNSFVEYWSQYVEIEMFINMILNMPMDLFLYIKKSAMNKPELGKKRVIDEYLGKYLRPAFEKNLYIRVREIGSKYDFILTDNMLASHPNSIKLTFVKK